MLSPAICQGFPLRLRGVLYLTNKPESKAREARISIQDSKYQLYLLFTLYDAANVLAHTWRIRYVSSSSDTNSGI